VGVVGIVASLALGACVSTAVVSPPATPARAAAGPSQGRVPPRDADGDGIPDADDKCPDDPETRNGYQDDDGCPDLAPQAPASPGDVGRIVERIGFQYGSAELRPTSFLMLDAIAVVLKMQPQQFPMVALEGHAAENEDKAMRLSLARASAVRVALMSRGVDGSRLLARASGATAPSCVQHNEACWTHERAVEFVTLPAAAPPAPAPETAHGEADTTRAPEAKAAAESSAPPVPLERIEFKKGSAVLAPAALANLDLLAGFMKATPASLEIVGYADERERGTAALADARAKSVRTYMMACGVSGEHLTTRAERTGRAACRSHSANCPARDGRAELRFVEPQAPAPATDATPKK
jgi:outer membrane protein OmpA-like peptidoglycan-associated protein